MQKPCGILDPGQEKQAIKDVLWAADGGACGLCVRS